MMRHSVRQLEERIQCPDGGGGQADKSRDVYKMQKKIDASKMESFGFFPLQLDNPTQLAATNDSDNEGAQTKYKENMRGEK